jgi:hypothetical protein
MMQLAPRIETEITELLATGRFRDAEDVLEQAIEALRSREAVRRTASGVYPVASAAEAVPRRSSGMVAMVDDWFEYAPET